MILGPSETGPGHGEMGLTETDKFEAKRRHLYRLRPSSPSLQQTQTHQVIHHYPTVMMIRVRYTEMKTILMNRETCEQCWSRVSYRKRRAEGAATAKQKPRLARVLT